MKLIIAGSRTIDKYRAYYEVINFLGWSFHSERFTSSGDLITEFVTGTCKFGADQVPYLLNITHQRFDMMGNNDTFEITEFPADWKQYGKKAGMIRNRQMAEYADELLLIWDGESSGSANMKAEMEKLGKPIYEIIIKDYSNNDI